ncbi:uncharacterized protein LOC131675242 [Phymastichus coffea]|uniref:uncharacterized protein LOC131675242 n=1 Tax=Phymastichus coffea TaxID=108790 RepID=UPI00273B8136|nr:uncharacterized protein LOC131675242 [Phymastichus coffea]
MKDEIRMQQLIAEMHGNSSQPELHILFSLKPGQDCRRYNFQRVNEVAAIFSTNADGEIPELYITIRNKNTKTLEFISSLDPNVEPWIYSLYYPYGTRGWKVNMFRTDNRHKITRLDYTRYRIDTIDTTRLDYTRYRIAIREDDFNPIIRGQFNNHQKELRADTYQGLQDHMRNCANDVNGHVGKTIILPSSFNGSHRYMQQCYQDAMAIVNETGKSDIFLTMTCNPNWSEITDNLLPGQVADRSDLVARVFDLKKDYLLDIVVKKSFFGKVASYVYVIEFQKRGLPHMHLLITLEQGYKITTADIVDKFISAELPIQIRNPRLFDIVMRTMTHGPCGDWCMKDGKCSKKFPKQFQDETTMDANGYPQYRRRDTGVDIKAVKYLYKYIYKGYDAATVVIGEAKNGNIIEHDEFRNYIETRYVGPVEACYRIFSKALQDKSHSVSRLPIHLPNEQSVIITQNEDELSLLAHLNNSSSMLLDYFSLNTTNDKARQYYYNEILKHFTYKKEKVNGQMILSWRTRQKHFNCVTNYNDLRTVDDVLHTSFTAACLALGIIEDDEEWNKAMREAVFWMMPQRLRNLFVRILIHCQPTYPEKLWKTFKDSLSENFSRNNDLDISYSSYNWNIQCSAMAYTGIAATLLPNGKTVHKTFGLPVPMFHDSSSNIKIQSQEGMLLKNTKVFIWDKAPMAPRYALEIVNRTLKYVINNDLPFGGKIMILGGDFRAASNQSSCNT